MRRSLLTSIFLLAGFGVAQFNSQPPGLENVTTEAGKKRLVAYWAKFGCFTYNDNSSPNIKQQCEKACHDGMTKRSLPEEEEEVGRYLPAEIEARYLPELEERYLLEELESRDLHEEGLEKRQQRGQIVDAVEYSYTCIFNGPESWLNTGKPLTPEEKKTPYRPCKYS